MSDDPADLSEEADELMAALAAMAGGEGMISARQDASNMLVSSHPDVLWTPMGGSDVAVPYPTVVAPMDKSDRLSMSVRNNGNYDFQLNSRTTYIKGHQKGIHKGVVVPGYETFSHVMVASDFVYSEGFATVAHGMDAWINHPDRGPEEPRKDISEGKL